LNPECGLEGFYRLSLLLRDVGPPIVVTTEHGLLQVAGAIFFHCQHRGGEKGCNQCTVRRGAFSAPFYRAWAVLTQGSLADAWDINC
jgi:hypothetical protein